jgi:hypothetical protein
MCHCTFKCRTFIILSIFASFLLIFLFLWFLGFAPEYSWNKNAEKTNCLIINNDITIHNAQCGPCGTNGEVLIIGCEISPDKASPYCLAESWTCNYYTVTIRIMYVKIYTQTLMVDNCESELYYAQNIAANFPNGTDITCYYNQFNHSDVRLSLYDVLPFEIPLIVIGVIAGSGLIVWIISEYVMWYKDHVEKEYIINFLCIKNRKIKC